MMTFHDHLCALMISDEVEPVHKARVALRRFRAVLSAFEPIIHDDRFDDLQDRSRALFRCLGGIRDADVMAARFAGTEPAPRLAEEAARQRRKARKFLKKKKALEFQGWVAKRLSGKGWRQTGKKAAALREAPVAVLAEKALVKAWQACLSNGKDLQGMSARAQHDLRKDLKALRYLSEAFGNLWPGAAQDAFLVALRSLQDDLGELTDTAMAQSLGHQDKADTANHQTMAAATWAALVERGPWWGDAVG
jgi:CHAD domain-containing protein